MRRRWRAVAAVVAGLLVVAVAFGAPGDGGDALDPTGVGPDGAAGLVAVLERLGAEVEVVRGPPPDAADTAVVLQDRLHAADREATAAWVRDGGVLLVADPASALADGAVDGPCPAALREVRALHVRDADDVVARDDGPPGTCFDGEVRVADVGDGAVLALDTPAPLLNDLLDEADDAVLAAAVLAPAGGTAVAFVVGPSAGADAAGEDSLVDLVHPDVRRGLLQAAIAAGLWAAWRARRLGRPVIEERPVAVAGSELVVAVGRLLEARRRPDEAAGVLRAEARRSAAARLGLPPDADVRTLAAALAGRDGSLEAGRVAAALGDAPVATDGDLLALAADLDRVRSAVLAHPVPPPGSQPRA